MLPHQRGHHGASLLEHASGVKKKIHPRSWQGPQDPLASDETPLRQAHARHDSTPARGSQRHPSKHPRIDPENETRHHFDRWLATHKVDGPMKCLPPRSENAIKNLVAIRAESWDEKEPGWTEIDTMANTLPCKRWRPSQRINPSTSKASTATTEANFGTSTSTVGPSPSPAWQIRHPIEPVEEGAGW